MEDGIKMKYVVDGTQMKEIDRKSIQEIGIPSMVLMERAAVSVVELIKSEMNLNKKDKILCVCGMGNNGGDGIAVGRILWNEGYQTEVYCLGNYEKITDETKEQLRIAQKIGIEILNQVNFSEYTVIVDGIFGIGAMRNIEGIYYDCISQINESQAKIVAIDIPSGIHSGSGKVLGIAVQADITVTFGYYKKGLLLYPGTEYTGKVFVRNIGFPKVVEEQMCLQAMIYEKEDLQRLPRRKEHSHKGTFGTLFVIAGSKNMAGACYLSAKAAYRMGTGLVKILTVEENREILQTLLPEAILETYTSDNFSEKQNQILEEIKKAKAIVIGPGLGKEQCARHLVRMAVENAQCPMVVDADGLNIIADEERTNNKQKIVSDNIIITPHLKEMSRLTGMSVARIQENIIDSAQYFSQEKCTVVLKDARTVVAKGEKVYINTTGNSGMATGGCGDVLSGMIGGLICQNMSPFDAAALGVYIHGMAGDVASEQKSSYSVMAQDIIDAIPVALNVKRSSKDIVPKGAK